METRSNIQSCRQQTEHFFEISYFVFKTHNHLAYYSVIHSLSNQVPTQCHCPRDTAMNTNICVGVSPSNTVYHLTQVKKLKQFSAIQEQNW